MANKVEAYRSEHIQTMDPLMHIRKFTGRYLGDYDTPSGTTHLIKEVIDNAVDEALSNPKQEALIQVGITQLQDSIQVVVKDHGRGIPLDKVRSAFSEPRTSGKWSSAYEKTAGVHGEGVKAVAAISKNFVGYSHRDGQVAGVHIAEGAVVTSRTWATATPGSGVTVAFTTDPSFSTTASNYITNGFQYLLDLLEFFSAFISNINFEIRLDCKHIKWGTLGETLRSIDKSISSGTLLNLPKRTPDIYMEHKGISKGDGLQYILDGKYYNASIYFDPNFDDQRFIGAVNFVPIHDSNSYHILGLVDAIKRKLAHFIGDSELRNYFITQYRLPVHGWVSVRVSDPKFVDQTKRAYRDRAFLTKYSKDINSHLNTLPDVWESVYAYYETHIRESYIAFCNKGMVNNKGLRNIGLRLNNFKCYRDCDSKDPDVAELFIAEGTSAGGAVADVRDPSYQAVFELRGKSINAIRTNTNRLYDDKVVKDLISVLGITPRVGTLDGLHFKRIIILTDADSDGKHISSLLIGMFHVICPELLNSGRVYISNPPLYALDLGKTKKFIKDEVALVETKIEHLYEPYLGVTLVNQEKGTQVELKGDAYFAFMFAVMNLGRLFTNVAKNAAMDPAILEMMCVVHDCLDRPEQHLEIIKKRLLLDQVKYYPKDQSLVLTCSSLDIPIPIHNLANRIRSELLPPLLEINWDKVAIQVDYKRRPDKDPELMSLVMLYRHMQALDDVLRIPRYKGLGEMSPEELYESCVDPETRSCAIIQSLGDVERLYAALGVDSEFRKQLIMS